MLQTIKNLILLLIPLIITFMLMSVEIKAEEDFEVGGLFSKIKNAWGSS